MKYDLVINAKKIITMDESNPTADWVAVHQGKIAAVGSGCPVPEGDSVLQLPDSTIVTGLIDSHIHASLSAVTASAVNLVNAKNAAEVLELVEERCISSEDDLVLASGYLPVMMEGGNVPTRMDIDRISHGKKVMILNLDGHGSTLNTRALSQLVFPEDLDGVHHDTGIIQSDAAQFMALMDIMDTIDEGRLEEMMDDFIAHALSLGITGFHGLEGQFVRNNKDIRIWQKKLDSMPIHMVIYPQIWRYEDAEEFHLPRHGGCLTLDGADVQWTMALSRPYDNRSETRGFLYHTDEELYHIVSKAHADGKQCSFHAMGDRAIDQILYIYQRVIKEQGDKGLRHRIEHFTLPADEQIQMAVDLGLVISAQPEYLYLYDFPGGHLEQYFGKERTARMECYKTWIDSGLMFAGGSDSPINGLNPLSGIHALVNSPHPGRRMNVTEALKCYTWNCAYAAFEEKERGSTEIGKYADFTVLDRNPYEEPDDIASFKVQMTIVNGNVVYKA